MDRRRASRITLLSVGAFYCIAALGLRPPFVFTDLVSSLPLLWEIQFVAAGILAAAFAVWPRSNAAYSMSLLMTNIAAGSRAMALLWLAREITPAMAWLIIVALQFYCWPHFAGHRRAGRG